MTGGRGEGGAPLTPPPGESPIIVLVRPQMARNIGSTARAMANGGLFHLRIVAPRDGWPQPDALPAASGADPIIHAAQVFDTLDAALADCHRVLATCPRPRHVVIPVRDARAAAEDLRAINAKGQRVAVLFGPERAGLEAEDLARAEPPRPAVPDGPKARQERARRASDAVGDRTALAAAAALVATAVLASVAATPPALPKAAARRSTRYTERCWPPVQPMATVR